MPHCIDLPKLKSLLEETILLSSTVEQCGFLIGDRLVETANVATSPSNTFQISGINLHRYLSVSSLIWHTHIEPDSDSLSFADIQMARVLNKPILSYHRTTKVIDYYDPSNPHPYPLLPIKGLEGLPYQWNRCDCHQLVRSWYEIELGVKLPKLVCMEQEEYQLGDDWNRAVNAMKPLGFHQVDESLAGLGTVVLMNLASTNPHHCGVITGLGEGGWMLLHHKTDSLSEITRLRKYRKFIHSYWNYSTGSETEATPELLIMPSIGSPSSTGKGSKSDLFIPGTPSGV